METASLAPVYLGQEITNNFSDAFSAHFSPPPPCPLDIVEVGRTKEWRTEEFVLVLQELLRSDHSINTKKALVSDLKHFYGWYSDYNKEVFQFSRCTKDDIIAYKAHLLSEQKATRSINRKLSHLRIFFRKAEEIHMSTANPTLWVRKLPAPQLIPRALSHGEYRRIIKETVIRDDIRAKCIFELMWLAGLRVSEVANLSPADITISERKGVVTIRNSKGNKTRQVPLVQELRETIQTYMEKHQAELGAFLFVGYGERLQEISIHKMLEKYGALANVSCTCHQFRHYFGTSFLQKNPGDVVALAQLMGHSSLQSTFGYTQNTAEGLGEKMEKVNL